jgi:hypothetical protein
MKETWGSKTREDKLAVCILKEQWFLRGLMRLISKLPKNAEGFRIQQVQTTIATS